ncbi:MAG: hypothetical protein U9N38_05710 [Thermodesulfobacteriota bacterium]|nr:hypothetical protein [Thermodesulfobacteriota bacterium]
MHMTKRKRYLFLIDDGWRQEKLDLLRYLNGKVDFDIATYDQATFDTLKDDFKVIKLEIFKTSRRFLYYFKKLFAHELPTNNTRYKRRIRLHTAPLPQRIFCAVHYIASLLSSPNYRYSDALEFLFRTSDKYGVILKDYDVLIFSPVHTFDKRIIYEAKNRGLDIVCWVYSWDNPMKDNEFMPNADRYFVWNEPCVESLCRLHSVPRDRVDIVGPVQFDFLLGKKNADKKAAPAKDLAMEKNDRYVLYACATALRAHISQEVNTVIYVRRIIDEIDPDVRLLVRPYPYRYPGTDDAYEDLANYENIELLQFGQAKREMVVMSKQDLLDRQSQIQGAECLINFGSTIGLEASFTDTPIIQFGFNFPNEYAACLDLGEVLKNEHLQLVIDPDFPNTVQSETELKKVLADILNGQGEPYRAYSKKLQHFAHPLDVHYYREVFLKVLRSV